MDAEPISGHPSSALSPHHSKWLFTLLAFYDNVLATSRDISALRSIARSCVQLISRSHQHEGLLAAPRAQTKEASVDAEEEGEVDAWADCESGRSGCWMIVAAVTFVWGQMDLWDDANRILLREVA